MLYYKSTLLKKQIRLSPETRKGPQLWTLNSVIWCTMPIVKGQCLHFLIHCIMKKVKRVKGWKVYVNECGWLFCVCRFRGYIRALLYSMRTVICQPGSLFRSHSKSSLDIGVVPVDRRRGGAIMKMELQHHTNNQAVRAARVCGGGGQRTRGNYIF